MIIVDIPIKLGTSRLRHSILTSLQAQKWVHAGLLRICKMYKIIWPTELLIKKDINSYGV